MRYPWCMKKFLCLWIVTFILTSSTFAKVVPLESSARPIQDYLFSVQVEWDQQDLAFLEQAEALLLSRIEDELNLGVSPQSLSEEMLNQIPNLQLREDLRIQIRNSQGLTAIQFIIKHHMDEIGSRGASWSPGKIILRMVITYAVLKGLMLVIYYWDSIGYEGSGDTTPPPTPPKT
jgi:hypothetical protein